MEDGREDGRARGLESKADHVGPVFRGPGKPCPRDAPHRAAAAPGPGCPGCGPESDRSGSAILATRLHFLRHNFPTQADRH